MFKASERAMIRCLMDMGTIDQVNGTIIINDAEVAWELQRLTRSSLDGRTRFLATVGCDFEGYNDVEDALDALVCMARNMMEDEE